MRERGIPAHESLRMAQDAEKEFVWSRMTSEDRAHLWAAVAPQERWILMPPSERAKRSTCCAGSLIVCDIMLNEGHRAQSIGKARMCCTCHKAIGDAKMTESPEGWSARSWELMCKAPTEFQRLNCVRNAAGNIVPLHHLSELGRKPDLKALAVEAARPMVQAEMEEVPF